MTGTRELVLAALDAGARDILDISQHVEAVAGERPSDLVPQLQRLRVAREIVPAASPRHRSRSAYQRTRGHVGLIQSPGAGSYPCGCVFVHDTAGAVVQTKGCQGRCPACGSFDRVWDAQAWGDAVDCRGCGRHDFHSIGD